MGIMHPDLYQLQRDFTHEGFWRAFFLVGSNLWGQGARGGVALKDLLPLHRAKSAFGLCSIIKARYSISCQIKRQNCLTFMTPWIHSHVQRVARLLTAPLQPGRIDVHSTSIPMSEPKAENLVTFGRITFEYINTYGSCKRNSSVQPLNCQWTNEWQIKCANNPSKNSS